MVLMFILDAKVLRIDLSAQKFSFSSLREYSDFLLGGRGVNQYILFNEEPVGISPFDSLNLLIIGGGLLVGTSAPGAYRINIDSKSPLTEGIGSSNVGGNFGYELKHAGISHIIISGRTTDLTYLFIKDGELEFKDAKHLKGKTVSETEKALKEALGNDVSILSVGPAGENLVRLACVMVDGNRAAGRCGLGAVFGSKNLKAIAVRGTKPIEVAEKNEFEKTVDRCVEKLLNNKFNEDRMKYGVYCYAPWDVESTYRNFSGKIPEEWKRERLLRDVFLSYKIGYKTCGVCPIHCWAIHRFTKGDEVIISEALQGNSIDNFGAKLDLADAKTVLGLHALCNNLGLDEDNVCGVIAWAFECYEKGLIAKDDSDGLTLEWGNKEIVTELIKKIANREGFGDLLAEGSVRASRKLGKGSEKLCVHVKGQELFECLWMSPSWALGVMVSPRGGTHTRGSVIEERLVDLNPEIAMDLFGVPSIGSISSYENKERLVLFYEKLDAALDVLGMCTFTNSLRIDMLLPEDYADLASAATGLRIDKHKLLLIGECVHNIEKCFNVLHTNWVRKDDVPPKKFVEVPLAGKYRIDLMEWNKMLDRYYALHGWSKNTGWPTEETLKRLNLTDIANKLKHYKKLP